MCPIRWEQRVNSSRCFARHFLWLLYIFSEKKRHNFLFEIIFMSSSSSLLYFHFEKWEISSWLALNGRLAFVYITMGSCTHRECDPISNWAEKANTSFLYLFTFHSFAPFTSLLLIVAFCIKWEKQFVSGCRQSAKRTLDLSKSICNTKCFGFEYTKKTHKRKKRKENKNWAEKWRWNYNQKLW